MSLADTTPIGIVAYSFALRRPELEPNPCNVALATAVMRARETSAHAVVVAQWEVARDLAAHGVAVDAVVDLPDDNSYLDSEGVWRVAERTFRAHGVTTVISVAQPFLQLQKVKALAVRSGFRSGKFRIGRIGFDSSRENLQWWTRGPVRLVIYAVLQATIRHRGKPPIPPHSATRTSSERDSRA